MGRWQKHHLDWVKVAVVRGDYDAITITCGHCGQCQVIVQPVLAKRLVALLNAMMALHSECQEPAPAQLPLKEG